MNTSVLYHKSQKNKDIYCDVLDLKQIEAWNEHLSLLPAEKRDIFFTPEYHGLMESYGDGKALFFIFQKEDQYAVYPFLLNSVNDLGLLDLEEKYYDIQSVYGYSGPIATTNSDSFIKDFYRVFKEYCNESNIIAEFIRFHPLIHNEEFSKDYVNVEYCKKTVYVDLRKELKMIWADMNHSCRGNIKKAWKSNLKVDIVEKDFNINVFIKLYQETMSRVKADNYYFFNNEYFRNIFKFENVCQASVDHKGELIASAICLFSKRYFHIHLAASSTEHLSYRPNNYLYYEIIKHAKKIGCDFLHLGSGSTTSENDSLLRFKQTFSNDSSNYYIGEKVYNKTVYFKLINEWENKYINLRDEYYNYKLKYRAKPNIAK